MLIPADQCGPVKTNMDVSQGSAVPDQERLLHRRSALGHQQVQLLRLLQHAPAPGSPLSTVNLTIHKYIYI